MHAIIGVQTGTWEKTLQPASVEASSIPAHQDWVDVAKGVGIILVVFGHAWRGLESSGILPSGPLFEAVDAAIYAFHMPLFFFLSGWLFPSSLVRRESSELLGRVFWRMVYPMCVWTYLFIAMQIAASAGTNSHVGINDLFRWPLPPYQHLWFLWALAIIQTIVILLRPFALRNETIFFAALAGISLIVLASGFRPRWEYLAGASYYAPFFLLGGLWKLLGDIPASRTAIVAATAAFIAVQAVVVSGHGTADVPSFLIGVVAVVSVLVVVKGLSPYAGGLGWLLGVLGTYSMMIYLAHTIFSAATRIVLVKFFNVHDLALHLSLSVLAGLFLPLLFYARAFPPTLRFLLTGSK